MLEMILIIHHLGVKKVVWINADFPAMNELREQKLFSVIKNAICEKNNNSSEVLVISRHFSTIEKLKEAHELLA